MRVAAFLMLLCALAGTDAPASPVSSVAPAPGQARSSAAGRTSSPENLLAEGRALYDKSDYGSALLKFEQAVKLGASGGELFYQMGYCYRTVRSDMESSRASMSKAVPLLEQELKKPAGRLLKNYYYLAAIHLNDIPDSDRLNQLAREATEALESGRLPKPRDGEEYFQLGRLYSFLGKRDIAAANYVEAIHILEKGGSGASKNPFYMHSLQAAGDVAVEKGEWGKAADLYGKLLRADPKREEIRPALALSLFKTGKEAQAIVAWEASTDPRMEGQVVYLTRIARRYMDLGRPSVQAPALEEELRKAILEAAKEYAAARAKDDEVAKTLSDKWFEEKMAEIQARKRASAKRPASASAGPAPDIPPDKMTIEQRLQAIGLNDYIPTPPPPPMSQERVAAEKKFFGLLAEMVRRGQLVRDFAITNGLAPVIFK